MKWETKFPIDYENDDIDKVVQKTKAEFKLVYCLLNALRQNFPLKSEPNDTLPFQWYIDIERRKIFVRNSKNDDWNVIGDIDKDYFGITAENIGAVANDGTLGKFSAGNARDLPPNTSATTNDVFFALDENCIYVFTGFCWRKFLSLSFSDLSGYEEYLVTRDEVATSGKDKVLRLDAQTGKGNIDISGSADRIFGYEVDVSNLRDGQVLAFNSSASKWTNQNKDALTSADISDSGAANKIVQTDNRGLAHVSITGSASIVGGVKVDTSRLTDKKVLAYNAANRDFEVADTIAADITGSAQKFSGVSLATNLTDGQFLKYNAVTKSLVSDSNEYLHEGDVSDTGARGKIVRVDNAGLIHANLQGSASLVGGVEVSAAGIKDGQVLAYNSSSKKFLPSNKDAITEENISEIGEVGKLIRLGADKTVHASVEQIDGVKFDISNATDGQLLSYSAQKKSVIPVAKDTNATSINNISVDTSNLKDGQVLIYDARNRKLVPADKDFVTEKDISTTGEVGKIIRVAANTPLKVDIEGSAKQIAKVPVVVSNIKDGDTLVYKSAKGIFTAEPKGATGEGKTLTFTKGADTICTYNGSGAENIDLTSADKLSTARKIKLTGYAQGQVDFDGSQDVELDVKSLTATLAENANRADEADKLSIARKIIFAGDATGTGEFDGSKNIVIALTVPSVASALNAANADFANQAMAATASAKAVVADTATSSGTAEKLKTARTIKFTGAVVGQVSFDGSGDVTVELRASDSSAITGQISTDDIDAMF